MPLGAFRLTTLSQAVSEIFPPIDDDVGVFAWGRNLSGQLGLDFTTGTQVEPFLIPSEDTNFVNASSGRFHSFGITTAGKLYAWGSNANGRTGLNRVSPSGTAPPEQIDDSDWISFSAGVSHSLGVKSDGTLWSWGFNGSGATGLNLTSGNTLVPTQVGTATNWAQVSAGSSYSLAITTTGELWAWGSNFNGQLGLGDVSQRNVPTRVGTATNWVKASASFSNFSLALNSLGEAFSWGSNANGRTGLNETTGDTLVPTKIFWPTGSNARTWTDVSAGFAHGFLISSTDELWSFGANNNGQLGDNSTTQRPLPVLIDDTNTWVTVSAGYNHNAAINSLGEIYCWGTNQDGRTGLGISDTSNTLVPTRVGTATNWVDVNASESFTNAIDSQGQLWSWGSNSGFASEHWLGIPDYILPKTKIDNTFTQISSSNSLTVALIDGKIFSCGDNGNGQTGQGLTSDITLGFTQIGTASNWTKIASARVVSGSHAMAVNSLGEIWGWGLNSNGQLGRGNTTSPQTTPVRIGTLSVWEDVQAGESHTIAQRTDGTLWAAGSNANGRTGRNTTSGNTTVFAQIGNATDWSKFSVGSTHNLAIKTDGTLWAWGNGASGRLGHNNTTNLLVPTQIGTDTDWLEVAAGHTHSLGIKTDGTLWGWGINTVGANGLGLSTGNTLVPTQVGTDTHWVKISAGNVWSAAIDNQGRLWTFGSGLAGRNTTLDTRLVPTLVDDSTNWTFVATGSNQGFAIKA